MTAEQSPAETDAIPQYDIAWRPTPESAAASRLGRFMARHDIATFADLVARSTTDLAWFWDAVVADLDLAFYTPYTQTLDLSHGIAWPRWFVGGAYNYVHNALDKHVAAGRGDHAAVVWEGEDGAVRRYSYAELYAEVNRAANALTALGVKQGDRVGIFLPMIPEVVTAVLAVGKIGAIFIPIFSGYAPAAVAARLTDCGATVLITADGFYRRGGVVPMYDTAHAALALAPSVAQMLVVRRVGGELHRWQTGRDVWWHDALAGQPETYETVRTAADAPYMIIYTSGTTGKPKGAVHVHAGFPIKSTQDMAQCFDVGPGDSLFWFTDMGWMMGPWAVGGALTLGATLALYEGAPDFPTPGRLWEFVERHRITVLGVSPTVIRSLMGAGDSWLGGRDLGSLRILGSTGEPWNLGPWRWFFDKIGGGRCPIINYSGGTEIAGGILGGNPVLPIKPCSFSGPVPGMAADVVDETGQPVRGAVGELVIRQPWVGMTHGFWQDRERYLDAYWSRLPDVWVHGDWAAIDADGFWYIQGRSDDTIKVAGKRVGPAEVEGAAVQHPAVLEAAAIGVPHPVKGDVIVVFAVLKVGHNESEEMREAIRRTITDTMGKALRPDTVRFVAGLPKTRNGKVMRRVIKAAYLGRDLGDLSALENPATVAEIGGSR